MESIESLDQILVSVGFDKSVVEKEIGIIARNCNNAINEIRRHLPPYVLILLKFLIQELYNKDRM